MLIVRLVELLIVIVPVIGLIYGGYKAVSKVRERADAPAPIDAAEPERRNSAAQWQAIMRMVREHDRTDTRCPILPGPA